MRKRSARKRSRTRRKSSNQFSFILRYIGIAGVVLILALALNKNFAGVGVLGKSIFLAQMPPPGGDSGGSAPPPSGDSGGSQPQQQSQPPPAESQPQQQSQPAQQSAPQPQEQPSFQQQGGPASPFQGGQQTPQYQPQFQPQQGGQQPQNFNQNYNSQQGNNYQPSSQQRSGSGETKFGPGTSGTNKFSEQQIQQFQQYEQQYKQEAAKSGIQFSGSLPPQLLQFQQQSQQNSPQQGQPNQQTRQFGGPNFQALPSPKDFPTITGRFEVVSQGSQSPINLNDANTRIQLGAKDLKSRSADGTEIQIDKDALEKINIAMQIVTGAQIQQTGNTVALKRGDITAQSAFPLSFNLATKTFTVQTANGEKELNVLPDQAVQSLIQNKVFSSVATTTSGQQTSSSVQLTEFENQPVFEVKGTTQERFLGFLPVTFAKTAYVSAENGEVLKTDTNVVSRILDLVSF